MPVTNSRGAPPRRKPKQTIAPFKSVRAPAVPLALALAVGIAADRRLQIEPGYLWLCAIGLLLVGPMLYWRGRARIATACLLLLVTTTGALLHHSFWFARPLQDVDHVLTDDRQLLKLKGNVVGFPSTIIREGEAYAFRRDVPPLTRFVLKLTQIKAKEDWQPASGCVRVDVVGTKTLAPGDAVEVFGFGQKLAAPRNPGEPDYRLSLWAQQIRGRLRCDHPELVKLDLTQRTWLGRGRLWLREKCDVSLRSRLKGDSLAVALAFLLGDRSLLSMPIRNAFIETGTMHVLAISGVHVTVLALFVMGLCRCLFLRDRPASIVVLLVSLSYLAIADVRPPMTRAFVIIAIWTGGQLLRRGSFSFNSLAVAAGVVLLLNPTDLFDVGAQLSFLAVATMVWWGAIQRSLVLAEEPEPGAAPKSDVLLPWWRLLLRPVTRWLWDGLVLSCLIWLVTLPLVASTFHVVSPIGPLVNLPLALVASPALWVGFLFVIASLVHPSWGAPFAWLLDWLLDLMVIIVDLAARVPCGHFYIPAPPSWWLIGIYGGIATVLLVRLYRRRSRWFVSGVAVWMLFGATLSLRVEPTAELRCTFLSVGHGCSVLIETPNGQALVYDVGTTGSGESAKRVLSNAIWNRHRMRIDVLLISHADRDHFNGALDLFDVVGAKRLLVSPQFQETTQLGAIAVLKAAREHGVSIEVVQRGERLELDPEVEMRVLHPSVDRTYEDDNAQSVVLEVIFRGRRILLTGDLENSGLHELLTSPARPTDIVLAPHHGSLKDSPAKFVRWAQPRWVVASSGREISLDRLQKQYGSQAKVFATSEHGAIEFRINANGEISHKTYGPSEAGLDAPTE